MWNFTFGEIVWGILGAGVLLAVIFFLVWVFLKAGNKDAEKYRNENPEVATIWIVPERFWGAKIQKVDGNKAYRIEKGMTDGTTQTFVLPGEHVLTIQHFHADPNVNQDKQYKKQRVSQFKVEVQAGKEYSLLFSQKPGDYSLLAGKPEEK